MKIGDKVRFLSETGGGFVAGFQGKSIVLVEDEDGFQIPTAINDVVVIGAEDYGTEQMVGRKTKATSQQETSSKHTASTSDDFDDDPSEREITFRRPVEERKGGDSVSAFLAFVPIDIHEMTRTRFETYLINDSNYYIYFTYMVAEGKAWHLKATGEVDPNTKLYIEEFGREQLKDMERIAVQMVFYKRQKPYLLKLPASIDLRIDPVKFYKLHTFRENDFFEMPAMVYPLVEHDKPTRSLVVDAQQLKKNLYEQI